MPKLPTFQECAEGKEETALNFSRITKDIIIIFRYFKFHSVSLQYVKFEFSESSTISCQISYRSIWWIVKIETVNMIYQFQAMYRITSLHYFSGIAVAKVIYLSNLMSLCNIVSQWYHVRFVWWADIGRVEIWRCYPSAFYFTIWFTMFLFWWNLPFFDLN